MSKNQANENFARFVQEELSARGFYKGAVDGWAGSGTHKAFSDFIGKTTTNPINPSKGITMMHSAERESVFGKFKWVHAPVSGNKENIKVTDNWYSENIRIFRVPQLQKLGLSSTGNVSMHKLMQPHMLKLWQAWEDSGVLEDVLSWEGGYTARLVRGSDTTLSNHAFGSAFDINAAWNGLGKIPTSRGKKGSVLRLVEIAKDLKWYWGGDFSRPDGMHFEASREMFS